MTDPEITQADRDAVNAFHSASFTVLFNNGSNKRAAHTLLLEAFARHRMLGRAEARVEIVVGYLSLRPPYGGDKKHIAIHRNDGPAAGEGGDFSVAKLEALLLKFYEENF